MISVRGDQSNSRGYANIGVLDFVSKSFILLPRESFEINEQAISWFSADQVIIRTDWNDDGNYVYIYSFDPSINNAEE